LLLAVM